MRWILCILGQLLTSSPRPTSPFLVPSVRLWDQYDASRAASVDEAPSGSLGVHFLELLVPDPGPGVEVLHGIHLPADMEDPGRERVLLVAPLDGVQDVHGALQAVGQHQALVVRQPRVQRRKAVGTVQRPPARGALARWRHHGRHHASPADVRGGGDAQTSKRLEEGAGESHGAGGGGLWAEGAAVHGPADVGSGRIGGGEGRGGGGGWSAAHAAVATGPGRRQGLVLRGHAAVHALSVNLAEGRGRGRVHVHDGDLLVVRSLVPLERKPGLRVGVHDLLEQLVLVALHHGVLRLRRQEGAEARVLGKFVDNLHVVLLLLVGRDGLDAVLEGIAALDHAGHAAPDAGEGGFGASPQQRGRAARALGHRGSARDGGRGCGGCVSRRRRRVSSLGCCVVVERCNTQLSKLHLSLWASVLDNLCELWSRD